MKNKSDWDSDIQRIREGYLKALYYPAHWVSDGWQGMALHVIELDNFVSFPRLWEYEVSADFVQEYIDEYFRIRMAKWN